MPKITVIVPAYNVGAYIQKCIESIMRQSFRDIQIIIINDGSTDGTDVICRNLSTVDCRITYIETGNKGVAAARNIGIEKAGAEWLCFVDGDDYLPENALETLYGSVYNADIIIGDYCTDKNGNIKNESFFADNVKKADKSKILWLIGNALGCGFYGAGYSANIGVPWGKLYRKDFLGGGFIPTAQKDAGYRI